MIAKKLKQEIDTVINQYIKARIKFYQMQGIHPDYLKGNDNVIGVIGVIGEYYAMLYLEFQGRNPVKVENRNQKGYDLYCEKRKISVKVVTAENKTQMTGRIKDEWDELVLIILNENYKPKKIGHLMRKGYKKARIENPKLSKEPYAKATMLGKKGVIGKYGKVINQIPNILK